MKWRGMKLSRSVAWMLVGIASASAVYWSLGKGGSAQTNWVVAALDDVLLTVASAAPPVGKSPVVPGGRGGMTLAQRNRRQSIMEYLRQRSLNQTQRQAEQKQLQD